MKMDRKAETLVRREEERMPDRECRLFRVEGHVQGVWFRESTRREAQPLGITGYAKNMPDGSVEVLACGEPGALNQLARWLENGPPLAQVERAEWAITRRKCPDSFVTI